MAMRDRLAGKWMILAALSVGPSGGCGVGEGRDSSNTVRIGYQKAGNLNVLRMRGELASSLSGLGVRVEWVAFPAGPQLLEALNAGSIDFGHTGDTPPILAHAAGVPFVYVAQESPRPRSESIIVRTDSQSARSPTSKAVASP